MIQFAVAFLMLLFSVPLAFADEPVEAVAAVEAAVAEQHYTEADRSHWSFRPVVRPTVPEFRSEAERGWGRNGIDAFILTRLREAQLQPAAPADRGTLIRRLSYGLLGLPPTPREITDFVNDSSPAAYENLVERLLADPRHGERWGQHWLDVVRFSESEGFEYDRHRPGAWGYRDYVISAFNDNKPYDQFVREQLAGDEIETVDTALRQQFQAAAGLHRLGPIRRNAGNSDVAFSRNEVLTEMTDMIGSAFLGLSLGCARCHDHKFDPISQHDYYRLQAFLAATHDRDVHLVDEQTESRWREQNDRIDAEVDKLKKSLTSASGETKQRLTTQLLDVERRRPAPLPTLFTVANDPERQSPTHLLIRGDEREKGPRVGMRYLSVLISDDAPELSPATVRPKTELANWLVDPSHPLTARVIVNRVWQYHFGRGLVETPNDFGLNGDEPTHPELLDWLADEFVAGGWNIKSLQRLILASNTFRQSSHSPLAEQATEIDAENRLLWRFARRRLAAEEIRDSLLMIADRINFKPGGESVMVPVDGELVNLLYKPAQWVVTPDQAEYRRRSIYLIAKRNLRLPFLEVFDQPDLQTSCPRRVASTHAPQALELLNGQFSNELAVHFAARLQREAGTEPRQQVVRAFLLAAGRPPSPQEQERTIRFLKTNSLREFALAVFNLNAFLYIE